MCTWLHVCLHVCTHIYTHIFTQHLAKVDDCEVVLVRALLRHGYELALAIVSAAKSKMLTPAFNKKCWHRPTTEMSLTKMLLTF